MNDSIDEEPEKPGNRPLSVSLIAELESKPYPGLFLALGKKRKLAVGGTERRGMEVVSGFP